MRFINAFVADKTEILRGTSGVEDNPKSSRKLSTSLSPIRASVKESNETLSSLSSTSKLTSPGAEEDGNGVRAEAAAGKEAGWEAACECFAEKLFCQNLHALDLSWMPRNVEFL